MKWLLCSALCVFLFVGNLCAQNDKPTENKYVKYAVALRGKKLRAGTTAHLVITLKPVRGIHINGTPPLTVKIDSIGAIAAVGKPDVPLAAKTGFVDTKKPIVTPVTFSRDLKAGPVTVRGTLVYYYCSDAEGWCSRYKQPIELTTTIGQ